MKKTSDPAIPGHYLSRLNGQETADPKEVIDAFFDYANLPQVKDQLWRWLEVTVTGSFNQDLFQDQRKDLLHFYQQLEKLLEATYLQHLAQQQK